MRSKVLAVFVLAAAAIIPAALALPSCVDPATRVLCGGRIIPPPLQSVAFLQHDSEFLPILDALEDLASDIIEIDDISALIGGDDINSVDGNDLYVIRITDESVTTPKRQVAISLSVHANEPAGREGGLRYIEDLATWWNSDKDHLLYTGDTDFQLDEVLASTEIYVGIMNPDGWATGDIGGGAAFTRENGAGVDLNRQFPTIGWTKANQIVQPEAQAWYELISQLPRLTTATDIHGETTSKNNAFSDIMYPAGEWSAKEQAQELQFAENMYRTVERKFEEEGVVLQTLFNLAADRKPMKPANFATAFDVVGYDDSGFMGDWFVREGAVELDVENFLSHSVPGTVWFPPLEQAHVAAVKGNMESTIVESMITHEVMPELGIGKVAYVVDPFRKTREAGTYSEPAGQTGLPYAGYDASRMQYFVDLAADAGVALTPIASGDLATTDLSSFDSLVLADMTVPADPEGRIVDAGAYLQALNDFATGGGQLVLTDSALTLLDDLGFVPTANIKTSNAHAGRLTFGAYDHPFERDLSGFVSQTYYAVPLGYKSGSGSAQAPHYGIDSSAWTAKGGDVAATVSSNVVGLGKAPLGAGRIAIFGAILPTQRTDNRIDYGLANYAVSVAGGEVLHTILEYRRPASS